MPRSALTVGELLEKWLTEHGQARLRARTLWGYQGYIDRYLPRWLERKRVTDVRLGDISELEASLLVEGGKGGRKLSGTTVLQFHRILSSAYTYGVRLGIIERNVVQVVEPPKTDRYEEESLDWEGVERLLDMVKGEVFRTLVLVALQTGLRRSELLGLQWRDVNFAGRQLSVRRAWVRVGRKDKRLEATKSGQSRVVDLPEESVEALLAMRAGDEDSGEVGFLFRENGSDPLDPDLVTQRFKAIAKKVGLGGIKLHDLRHTHASLMLSGGVHLKLVSERLGRSRVGITADLYSHVLPTVQLEAMERFGGLWRSRLSKR